MVSAFVSRSSSLGLNPGQELCVAFSCKTLCSHSAPLHPAVQMGTGPFTGPFAGGNPAMD